MVTRQIDYRSIVLLADPHVYTDQEPAYEFTGRTFYRDRPYTTALYPSGGLYPQLDLYPGA